MDYLNKYAKTSSVAKFQMGGEMPAEGGGAPAPAGGGGGDLQSMLMQFAETQDPQLAVQICNMLLEQLSGGQGGAPTPAAKNGMELDVNGRMVSKKPIFAKGGKLAV